MMRVTWNYYTVKGKAEGITQLNHCVAAYGTKADCAEVMNEHSRPSSQAYTYIIKPSKTKPKLFCLHVIWNGFYD